MADKSSEAITIIESPRPDDNLPVRAPEQQVQVFTPLDAEPVAFKQQLENRQENYDALAVHLRNMLVPDKDFGRIHHANEDKCPEPWRCSYEQEPRHWSDYGLWAPGADKVCGMLSLSPSYPGHEDYIRAAVTGKKISDVIIKCQLLGTADRVITEGMGACALREVKNSLNNAIKRACKRARVDAVMRIPAISALFEDDFLAQVAAEAARKGGNSTTARTQQVNPKHNTGARLQVFPLKGKLAGQRFDEMDDGALDWCLRTFETSKPDIFKAAKRERDARGDFIPPPSTADGPAKDSAGEGRQGQAAGPAAQPGGASDYHDYPEAQ